MTESNRGNTGKDQALFCLGLGAHDAWWISMSLDWYTSGSVPEWGQSVAMHAAYLLVQLVCFGCYAQASSVLSVPRRIVVLGVIASLFTLFEMAFSGFFPQAHSPLVPLVCLAAGSSVSGLIMLAWMREYAHFTTTQRPVSLMLASMATGATLWLVISLLPLQFMQAIIVALPLCSTLVFFALTQHTHAEIKTSPKTNAKTPKSIHAWPLTPVFLGGIFIYELAPGLVTGVMHFNGITEVYALYAAGMVVVAVLATAFGASARFAKILDGFVVPLLSIGLFAFSLLSVEESAAASASTLLGSMLFETFLFARFAEISVERREEPLRVFSLGGLAVQSGLLFAYLAAPLLATSAKATLGGIAYS